MAIKVEIAEELKLEIFKKFKGESKKILKLIKSLEDNPNKGKLLGNVGGVIIKELKYNSFRFYFITDGFKLRIINQGNLVDLLIKFVRMSDKKSQQKTIEEIKEILRKFGEEIFY
jgi:hypothetical protein